MKKIKKVKGFKRHVLTKKWKLYTFTSEAGYLDFVDRKGSTIWIVF